MLDPTDIALNLRGRFGYQQLVMHTSRDYVLGSGAYGNVVKATLDEVPCAAKILHRAILDSGDPGVNDFVTRFEQEIQILRDLKHACIVQFLCAIQDPTTRKPILLMKLMKESLTHFLENSARDIPYHVQVNIAHDISLAIVHLHRNGVLHRDLSSNNVLLNDIHMAKVTDFGMSKIADNDPSMTRSQDTICPGTLVFMPPEALRPQPRYSDKIDSFSIGVLLVQIVTRNFPSPTAASITKEDPNSLWGEIDVPIPEVERRKSDIDKIPSSHGFLSIVCHCLKDRSKERPTAAQLCQSLGELKTSPAYKEAFDKSNIYEVGKLYSLLYVHLTILQEVFTHSTLLTFPYYILPITVLILSLFPPSIFSHSPSPLSFLFSPFREELNFMEQLKEGMYAQFRDYLSLSMSTLGLKM